MFVLAFVRVYVCVCVCLAVGMHLSAFVYVCLCLPVFMCGLVFVSIYTFFFFLKVLPVILPTKPFFAKFRK